MPMHCHVCGRPVSGTDVVIFFGLGPDLRPRRSLSHIACSALARVALRGPITERWVRLGEYRVASGRWAPRAVVYTRTPHGLEARQLDDPRGRTFALHAEAKAISRSMATEWLLRDTGT